MKAPKLSLEREEVFTIGEDTFIDSINSKNRFAVVFEDDMETGYFYAISNDGEQSILDALHIYNVSDVIDKSIPSVIKLFWNLSSTKAFLIINDYCHAVFDFENNAGYCRNGFPESRGNWVRVNDRKLTDELLENLM